MALQNGATGAAGGKSIVLFSDGTGNSSGKLFKTNVWRMYEAVNLGPATGPGERAQIAYYDNGVGTSTFKPWAVLSGIFGFGLKRNILSLYRFLCRNYQEGDHIYAFGFSRGAFTIRIAIALICEEGIIRYDTEKELNQRSLDALRRFARRNNPNFFPFFAMAGRLVRDGTVFLKRLVSGNASAPRPSYHPDIEFVGVWDTVAAYGGPFAEITRAIDNWIWPLTMTDYQLSPRVQKACHALALDDERDSFQPLLWDEFKESLRQRSAADAETKARRAAARATGKGDVGEAARLLGVAAERKAEKEKYGARLQQVWFAGMHSDVGGGYPDESLSYVSLRWMMDQARPGLRLLDSAYQRVAEISNSFGPIHDSRRGLGSYYRYQPRKIAAFMHPHSQPEDVAARRQDRIVCETLSLRDPTMGEQEYRPQGFLLSCKVHESVVARITSGTDDYAPIGLPDSFEIVPPAPAKRPAAAACLYKWTAWKSIAAKNRIAASGRSPRGDCQESIWDEVYRRRLAYFAAVASTLLLLSLPLPLWGPALELDDRSIWGRLTGAVASLLPDLLDPWIGALRDRPYWFAGFLAAIIVSRWFGARFSARIKDRTRRLWCDSMLAAPLPPAAPSGLRRWRNSKAYQRALQILKWRLLPNLIFGPLLVVLIIYALAVLATQLKLVFDEPRVCPPPEASAAGPDVFRTDSVCHATGVTVEAGHDYAVEFTLIKDWRDGSLKASPRGVESFGSSWPVMWLATPLRRVVTAPYLEPLYEVRSAPPGEAVSIHIGRLQIERVGDTPVYRGTFRARRDGDLFLFANDAVAIWDMSFFYTHANGKNEGTAAIKITDQTPAPATGPAADLKKDPGSATAKP